MSNKKERTKGQKFLRFLFIKFPIILIVLGIIFLGALKMVERFPEPLQAGFEDYLSQTTRTNATITEFQAFKFVPNVVIQFGELTLHNQSNTAKIDLKADYIEVTLPFWAAFFGRPILKTLDIDNLEAKSGVVTPQDLKNVFLSIEDREGEQDNGTEQYGSFVIGEGIYAGEEFSFEAKIEKKPKYYEIPKEMRFSLTLGEAELNGLIHKTISKIHLKDAIFKINGEESKLSNYVLVEGQDFVKDNPLFCLLENGVSEICETYVRREESN
ncbi:MAG: hypothetical protein AAF549_01240 [Pseudomonadota bacterium]